MQAKKKAQAAAKKASGGGAAPSPAPAAAAAATPAAAAEPTAEAAGGEDDDEADEAGADGGAKNKKKKKKKAGAADKAPEPEKLKKLNPRMELLRLQMEARKAAEEEAARLQREHEEALAAEDRRLEEEEKAKEEARAVKKEKERAKKEQLKKEGKLLTPKQKAEKAAAELRLKALMASGNLTVAGLSKDAEAGEAPKKVSYASKKKEYKKKGPAGSSAPASPAVGAESPASSKPPSPEPPKVEPEEEDDVKDDWDASEPEEEKKVEEEEDVKDDWDASSSEEEKEEPKPAPAPAPVAKPAPAAKALVKAATNGKDDKATPYVKGGKPVVSKSVPDKAASAPKAPVRTAKGKPAPPVEESSSEEEDEDDDDSEDDSDDSDEDSDDSYDSDESSSEEELTATEKQAAAAKAAAKARRLAKEEAAQAAKSKDNMRSPICVILGHVDTGKTKLLDKIRQTNVQEGEAGGITQQIGATFFPMEAIKSKTAVLGERDLPDYKLPGLLVIDTPGHESFTNLRTRGSSLCNIAILVVDIMHGLEPQTIESLKLLRDGKTPFIVALNKIDRLYGWNAIPNGGFLDSLESQNSSVKKEFDTRLKATQLAFAELGLNSKPYYENDNLGRNVSLVPTSAHTGEGVPDMLMLIIKLTQERMSERLMYISTLECTVLEVKVIEGLGTTIDVVLSNGVLYEGDKIVVCGLNGPIVTQVRALLTPQPMKEMRVKGQYVHHKMVKASLGIKIVAPDLEKAIAGSRLLVCGEDEDEEELKEEVMTDLQNLLTSVDKSGKGVCVQASTLGSLEALLEFLRTSKIPVSGINIGPVHKKDVMRAATMLEKAKELAVILCFDVPVDKEAEKIAAELDIKIFKADIIYHLFDQFTKYNKEMTELKRTEQAGDAVWPCRLKTIACFAKRDPIILGCDILDGSLRVGTPLCVVKTDPETKAREIIHLGKITSLEINHKVKDVIKRTEAGAGVAVKIEHASYESAKQYGRHFDENDVIYSQISRKSIDVLKEFFRDDVPKEDWVLIKKLKAELQIA